MGIRELFLDMQVSLLSSADGGDVIRLAAVLAEATLKGLLGQDPQSRAGLGEMIGEAHRHEGLRERLGKPLLLDLNWLNERRLASVHFKGKYEQPSIEEGRRGSEIVTALLERTGQCEPAEIRALIKEAEWKASAPATSSVLKLDRSVQRGKVDDLLGLPLRLTVVMVDGEIGQGHDHFGQVMHWRLRAVPKGRWRELRIEWPAPSDAAGTRFAQLVELLAAEIGATLQLPDVDPLAAAGAEPWDRALGPLVDKLARCPARLYVRHPIGWLSDGDPEVIDHYLRRIWAPVGQRPGDRALLAFEVQRAAAAGLPMGRAWRLSRRERRVAADIARNLDDMHMPDDCRCAILDELTSVTLNDLVQWFRTERNLPRAAAEQEGSQVMAATQGGRFEAVVKRITSLATTRGSTR